MWTPTDSSHEFWYYSVPVCLQLAYAAIFSIITANYWQNSAVHMLKCFSFWGLRPPDPLPGQRPTVFINVSFLKLSFSLNLGLQLTEINNFSFKSKKLLDLIPGKTHRTTFTVIEFDCYISAFCTSVASNSVKWNMEYLFQQCKCQLWTK